MNRNTFEYDSAYQPAMPVAEISIRGRTNGASQTLVGIVDSGSDNTILPLQLLEKINARVSGIARMSGVLGQSQPVELYKVILQVGNLRALGIDVIADRTNRQILIGRDVINQFIVTLNAPAHEVVIEDIVD